MSPRENREVNQWVGKLLVALAKKGLKPGFSYGKGLYYDLFDFFECVASAVGRSPLDIAIQVAMKDLTRVED
jgi:hypothetical protein